jgi:hypothetical protein
MLPPDPTRRRPPLSHDFEAGTGLQHPLSTLQERRRRRPRKTRFRLAGCAFAGRGSNPLDRVERFPVTSFLLPRTFPDASWVHAERLIHKLDAFNEAHRAAQQAVRGQIWDLYRDLVAYKNAPSSSAKAELEARFDAIFQQRTGFATLDKLLKRLRANKAELLVVLDRPEIPLHTNGTENTIRDYVTKRKVSGGTRSDYGRDCRDAFLGLLKTCKKQGVNFWDYLGARLKVPNAIDVPSLPALVKTRCAAG